MILTYLGFNFDRERESKFQGTSRKSQMCLFTISWVCNSIGRDNLIDKSCFLFYSNDTKPLAFVSPYGSSEEQVSVLLNKLALMKITWVQITTCILKIILQD